MNELDKLVVRLSSVITGLEARFMEDQRTIAKLQQEIKAYEVFCEANLASPIPEKAE